MTADLERQLRLMTDERNRLAAENHIMTNSVSAAQAGQNSAKQAVEAALREGIGIGWNALLQIIHNSYDPMTDLLTDLDHIAGVVEGLLMSDPNNLPPKEIIQDYAVMMGNDLSSADIPNKAITAPIGGERGFYDLSVYHEWRNAMADYASGQDKHGKALRRLVGSREGLKRHISTLEALKKRDKERELSTLKIAQGIDQRRKEAKANRQSLTLEQAAEATLAELGYHIEIHSAIQHYYRCKKDGSLKKISS